MLLALGALSSVWGALQSLTSSSTASSAQSSTDTKSPGQFDLSGGAGAGVPSASSVGAASSQISPETMSALLAAQSQSGSANSAPLDPSQALQDLFSQIDGNGNGQISKQEFEGALGAGGTNLAAADDVFSKLDRNGDGSVSLDELKSALRGGHHHHHHMATESPPIAASTYAAQAYSQTGQLIGSDSQATSTAGTSVTPISIS
jgi:Ca2+-binding EF-hand superfamily protein